MRPASPTVRAGLAGLLLLAAAARSPAADGPTRGDDPDNDRPRRHVPEVAEMAWAILARGSQMGPDDGWFHPSKSRYGWDRLAARHDADGDGSIAPGEFRGPAELFERLDRDRDGAVTAEDLDWTAKAAYFRQVAPAGFAFAMADTNRNGRVSREEWLALFDRAAAGRPSLGAEDLRNLLIPPTPRRAPAEAFRPGDAPTTLALLKGLAKGELGSRFEGPGPGQLAPDFTLKPQGGGRAVTLSESRGKRPVVLVLGNFTCGPFRSRSGDLDALYRRYRDRAEFLAVYVREAHPTDGWRMASNDRVGVAIPQPRVDAERIAVAQRCSRTLELTIPLLVDTVDDHVGNAYSGMPDRLYVLDRSGTVAYQSGRGPFGFKPGELEQALVMLLLDQESPAEPAVKTP